MKYLIIVIVTFTAMAITTKIMGGSFNTLICSMIVLCYVELLKANKDK